MSETREQIVERMARAEWGVIWPDSDPYLMGAGFLRATAASLPVAVKAVTDRVRELHQSVLHVGRSLDVNDQFTGRKEWTTCSCGRADCPTVRPLDQIDAEMGGE